GDPPRVHRSRGPAPGAGRGAPRQRQRRRRRPQRRRHHEERRALLLRRGLLPPAPGGGEGEVLPPAAGGALRRAPLALGAALGAGLALLPAAASASPEPVAVSDVRVEGFPAPGLPATIDNKLTLHRYQATGAGAPAPRLALVLLPCAGCGAGWLDPIA